MNKNLVQGSSNMDNNAQVMRALDNRRTYILTAIGDRVVEPPDELMQELAELNIALDDFPVFEDGE